jgi:hypothetical protein
MIIQGTSVQGIFTYEAGLNYEVGDIILYNDILYSVIDHYTGDATPDISTKCIPYVVRHATTDINDLSNNDLVLASTFQLLLNSFFDGLNLRGEIDTIRTSEVDIDSLTSTGAHILIIDSLVSVSSLLPQNAPSFLIRIYRSNNVLIQEIVDYISPSIVYRSSYSVNPPIWGSWDILINTGDIDNFKLNLSSYLSKVDGIINKIKLLENDSRIVFRDVTVPPNNGNVTITDDVFQEGVILNIGFEYIYDGYKFQEFVSFDLSSIAQSTSYNTVTNSGKTVYLHRISANSVLIQLLDNSITSPKVIRILASKKYSLL